MSNATAQGMWRKVWGNSKAVNTIMKSARKTFFKINNSGEPMKELGVGISTFHKLLVITVILFILLSLLHIPNFTIFYSSSFYNSDDILTSGTLGNLGFSKTECVNMPMIAGNKLNMHCSDGSISQLVDWGIVTSFEDSFQCKRKDSNVCDRFL